MIACGLVAHRVAIGVVRRNFVLPVEWNAEAGVEGGQRRQARADRRGTVIALFDRDELVLRCGSSARMSSSSG